MGGKLGCGAADAVGAPGPGTGAGGSTKPPGGGPPGPTGAGAMKGAPGGGGGGHELSGRLHPECLQPARLTAVSTGTTNQCFAGDMVFPWFGARASPDSKSAPVG